MYIDHPHTKYLQVMTNTQCFSQHDEMFNYDQPVIISIKIIQVGTFEKYFRLKSRRYGILS